MKAVSTLPLLLLGILVSPVMAAEVPAIQLTGIDTVKLEITVSKELVDMGFPGARVRTQAELQLRKAGLKVDPKSDGPTVSIDITGVPGPGTNSIACTVQTSVSDTQEVQRNKVLVTAPVWGADLYVLFLSTDISQTLLDTSSARLDLFINDWLEVNPR